MYISAPNQSNSVSINNASKFVDKFVGNGLIWNGNKWETLATGINTDFPNATNVAAWEVEFLKQKEIQTGNPTYLFKYAVNATALCGNPNTDWNIATGELYTDMIVELNQAIAYLETQNITINFKGIISYQGESDALNSSCANNWGSNYEKIISGIRSIIGNVKVAVCRINQIAPCRTDFPFDTVVRTEQANWVTSDGNAILINTDIFNRLDAPDCVHLTVKGEYELGYFLSQNI